MWNKLKSLFKKRPVQLTTSSIDEMHENYLFDFRANQFSSVEGNTVVSGNLNTAFFVQTDGGSSDTNTPPKIKIKPIDVVNELETIPTPFTMLMLDEKLSVLEDKRKLINQHYAKREVEALIERLTARKKYPKFKQFFDEFQNTTDEKIGKLLDKYDLVMKTSDIFIPEFPDEAISVMKAYTEKVEEVTGKKPVFYVIAEPDKFRKAYERRDPILLAQSPFGFYWQILGAWDKEMLLLSEL